MHWIWQFLFYFREFEIVNKKSEICWDIQYDDAFLSLKCTRKDARALHERQECFILLWLPIRIFVGMSQWFEKISDFVFGVTVKGPSTNLTLQTKNFSSKAASALFWEGFFLYSLLHIITIFLSNLIGFLDKKIEKKKWQFSYFFWR